jgi:DNA sulfur modification protein DndE
MTKIVGEAILFDMYYAAKDPIALIGDESGPIEIKAEPVTEATPEFRDFYMENIYCNGAKTAIGYQWFTRDECKKYTDNKCRVCL